MPRKLIGNAWKYMRRHWKRAVRCTVGLLILVSAGGYALANVLDFSDLGIIGTGIAAIWLLSVIALVTVQIQARRVRASNKAPERLAPPLSSQVERRLERLSTANVVVYDSEAGDLPFIGSGYQADHWDLSVDVELGAKQNEGVRRAPEKVEIADLHAFLETAFGRDESPTRWFGHRLYADGSKLSTSPLLTTPYGPPVERIAHRQMVHEISQSENEHYQRVYFCLQSVRRNGELVVELLVRPHFDDHQLFFEIELYAVLPLDRQLARKVLELAPDLTGRVWRAVWESTRTVPARPFRSLRNCILAFARIAAGLGRRAVHRRAVRKQRRIDFGSYYSARELPAVGEFGDLSQYEEVDFLRTAAFLQYRLLAELKRFLDSRGVDTEAFEKRRDTIVQNIQNWKVSNITGKTFTIGHNGRIINDLAPAKGTATSQHEQKENPS